MLTKTTYPLNVALIRRDLTDAPALAAGIARPRTTPNRLAFGADYRSLGLDRNAAFRMNIEEVNGAVISVYHVRSLQEANGLKDYYWKLAVAFAEAVRFDDVLERIVNDKPIDDLDWTKHKRQDKVRVVKS